MVFGMVCEDTALNLVAMYILVTNKHFQSQIHLQ